MWLAASPSRAGVITVLLHFVQAVTYRDSLQFWALLYCKKVQLDQ